MATFLFVPHHRREEAVELAKRTIQDLERKGHRALVLEEDAQPTGLTRWAVASVEEALKDGPIDLAISLGGDGTMLRALDRTFESSTPTMGVNMGHLGYLSEIEPKQLDEALERFISGNYSIEDRMTLEVDVSTEPVDDPTHSTLSLSRRVAVNEVVVERMSSGNTVRLNARINGEDFLSYAVDGMIIATPTGSTAYNLSARGPILTPTMQALLLTPVAPHMLFDRSLVLNGDEVLELTVVGTRSASVLTDGRHISNVAPGGTITCRRSNVSARVVVFGISNFRRTLKEKFGLTDR